MGGGGLRGSIRTTLDSTLGGGLKLFLPTYGREGGWLQSQNYGQSTDKASTKGQEFAWFC